MTTTTSTLIDTPYGTIVLPRRCLYRYMVLGVTDGVARTNGGGSTIPRAVSRAHWALGKGADEVIVLDTVRRTVVDTAPYGLLLP